MAGAIPVVRSVLKSSPRSITYGRLRQREVKHLIDNAHHIAGAILAHNQPLLKEVAEVLLEREILDGQKLHDYLDRVKIPPLLAVWLQSGEISLDLTTDVRFTAIGNGLNSQHLYKNLR